MHEHFSFRSHLCIVFELLSFNLYEFMKSNAFMGVSLALIRRFAVQARPPATCHPAPTCLATACHHFYRHDNAPTLS